MRLSLKITITYQSNATAAESIVAQIQKLGSRAVAVRADAADPTSASSTIKQTRNAFGTPSIDILVNNAADTSLYQLDAIDQDKFHATFDTNVLGPLLLIQGVMPVIRRGGRIINISSRQARTTSPGAGVYLYAASKAALEHMTRNLAAEWAEKKGITVNNVMPGPTDTGEYESLH